MALKHSFQIRKLKWEKNQAPNSPMRTWDSASRTSELHSKMSNLKEKGGDFQRKILKENQNQKKWQMMGATQAISSRHVGEDSQPKESAMLSLPPSLKESQETQNNSKSLFSNCKLLWFLPFEWRGCLKPLKMRRFRFLNDYNFGTVSLPVFGRPPGIQESSTGLRAREAAESTLRPIYQAIKSKGSRFYIKEIRIMAFDEETVSFSYKTDNIKWWMVSSWTDRWTRPRSMETGDGRRGKIEKWLERKRRRRLSWVFFE